MQIVFLGNHIYWEKKEKYLFAEFAHTCQVLTVHICCLSGRSLDIAESTKEKLQRLIMVYVVSAETKSLFHSSR